MSAERSRRGRPSNQAREARRIEGLFWVARQILRADTDADRARILLRLPDLLLTQKADVLREACQACDFNDGVHYIDVRSSVCSATRDAEGQLPPGQLAALEFWRRGMVSIASRFTDRDREIAGWPEQAGAQ